MHGFIIMDRLGLAFLIALTAGKRPGKNPFLFFEQVCMFFSHARQGGQPLPFINEFKCCL